MANGGKTTGQRTAGTFGSRQRTHAVRVVHRVLGNLAPVKEGSVHVRVDHTGCDRQRSQVNDFAALRGSGMRTDLQNGLVLDQNFSIFLHFVPDTVVQPSAEQFFITHVSLLFRWEKGRASRYAALVWFYARNTAAPGPSGRLKAIHTMTCAIQTMRKAMEYGSVMEMMVPIPVFFSYFCAIPMTMGR